MPGEIFVKVCRDSSGDVLIHPKIEGCSCSYVNLYIPSHEVREINQESELFIKVYPCISGGISIYNEPSETEALLVKLYKAYADREVKSDTYALRDINMEDVEIAQIKITREPMYYLSRGVEKISHNICSGILLLLIGVSIYLLYVT
jgi:hypothetical protein